MNKPLSTNRGGLILTQPHGRTARLLTPTIMHAPDEPVTPPPPTDAQPVTPPAAVVAPVEETPPVDDGNKETFRQEAERRKRQNDALQAELDELKRAQMTEQEAALAAARDEGRAAGAREIAIERAADKLDLAAAKAGVDLTPFLAAGVIKAETFVGADGAIDTAAITAAVALFPPITTPPPAQPTAGVQGAPVGANPTLEEQIAAANTELHSPDPVVRRNASNRLISLNGELLAKAAGQP